MGCRSSSLSCNQSHPRLSSLYVFFLEIKRSLKHRNLFLSLPDINTFFELTQSYPPLLYPQIVSWILEVAPSNLGLKVNLANSSAFGQEIQAPSWLLFGMGNAQYRYYRQLQKGMPGLSLALDLYLHVNSLSAILWRQMNRRPARGTASPKYTNHIPVPPWSFKNETRVKWVSLDTTSGRLYRSMIDKWNM